MNKVIFVACVALVASSLKINHQGIPGGWSQSNADPDIDNYIRTKIPVLKDANLTKSESQVVAGINYLYTYQKGNIKWQVGVFDQAWTKTRNIESVVKTETIQEGGVSKKVETSLKQDSRPFNEVARSVINS